MSVYERSNPASSVVGRGAGWSPSWARGSPCGAGVSVTHPYAGDHRVDPARRACPTSARAYGLWV